MGASVAELQQERAELIGGVEEILAKAKKEGRELSAEEQANSDNVLDVKIPALERELKLAEAKEHELKSRAIEQVHEQSRLVRGADERLTFRDAHSGRLVRALGPNDRLASGGPTVAATWEPGRDPSPSIAGGAAGDRASGAPDIGEVLVAKITGRPADGTEQLAAQIGAEDTAGGSFLTPSLGAQVIDLARAPAVSVAMGAQTVPMTGSQLDLVRVDSDPVAHWRAEAQKVQASQAIFGRISLRPKTLAAVVPVSIELLEDASNAAQIIRSGISKAMALQLDRAVLMGQGAESEPRGITNNPGVNTVTGVGTPADYSKVTAAVGKIMRENYDGEPSGLGMVMHPRDAETFDGLVDTTGQPLQPTPWASALRRATTSSMPTELGGGGNESEMIIGAFNQVLIGIRTSVTIRVLDSGVATDSSGVQYSAAEQLLRLIVVYLRADVAVLRPSWFTVLSGVTAA